MDGFNNIKLQQCNLNKFLCKRNLILAIDFDGTIVDNKWPGIGDIKQNAKEVINDLVDNHNCDVILWTCRDKDNNEQQKAIDLLIKENIKFHSVNTNTDYIKSCWTINPDCRKVYADLYIDDKSLWVDVIDWLDIRQRVLNFKLNNKEQFN